MLFIFIDNNNPGPSDYEQKELIGRIFNSKYRSSEGKSMYGRYKISDRKANEPGPGQYRVFSEFGIYESKYAKTEPNEPPPRKERVEIPREVLKPKPKPKPKKIEPIREETHEDPKPLEENKPEESKEEPKTLEDNKPEEIKNDELKEENKPEEPKVEESKPEEEKKDDNKPEEPKIEEEKKEEPKVEDNKVEGANPEEEKKEEANPEGPNPEEEKKEEVPATQGNIETTAPAQ